MCRLLSRMLASWAASEALHLETLNSSEHDSVLRIKALILVQYQRSRKYVY